MRACANWGPLGDCPRCLKEDSRGLCDDCSGPAQSLDGLPWRSEPPDAVGFWFLTQKGERAICCWVENLHAETGGWSEDWSCAPCPPL